ncbi:MAG: S9 family peptidase [Planctomycetaceae bacterium]
MKRFVVRRLILMVWLVREVVMSLLNLLLSVVLGLWAVADEVPPKAPVAPAKAHSTDFHGMTLEDPYFWMKDKTNPDVIRYLEAENSYRESVTQHLGPLTETLYQEMLSHIRQTDLGVPVFERGYWYYSRTAEGLQYPQYCRRKGSMESAEELLLDVNVLAEGQKFMSAVPAGVSDNGQLYAWLTDITGFREYYLSIRDLGSGRLLEDRFVKAAGFAWSADNRTLFYIVEDEAKRAYRLFRHVLGQPVSSDVLVYEESDELYTLAIDRTRDGKYLIWTAESSTTTEQHFLDSSTPTADFRLIAARQEGVEYQVDHRDGQFHIRTNLDGAINFRWMVCDTERCGSEHWRNFEAIRPSVFLEGISLFRNFAVIEEREAGNPQLRVHNFGSGASYRVEFPEPSYMAGLGVNPEFDTDTVQFTYTSLVTPASVYSFNLLTQERQLLKATEVPGGFESGNYVSERIEATAADGVKVPISLVYRRGLVRDGTAPLYLYSYGSYGYSTEPVFSASRLVLLDRGVVFALAHIRGGSDLGYQWYLDGKLMKKKNSFTDFIACADHLVQQKYGARERLAIEGGSAGGLLIGAVLNLRPDICRVAHLAVPFVDVINTMLDESLPLTVQEFLEWGNPKERVAGRYMLEYSPYDNIGRRDYPAILVTTSLNDSQVLFHEPTKYVARLRALKTDANVLLLKCNMDAGHGGASGRYESLREQAYEYAVLLDQIGLRR